MFNNRSIGYGLSSNPPPLGTSRARHVSYTSSSSHVKDRHNGIPPGVVTGGRIGTPGLEGARSNAVHGSGGGGEAGAGGGRTTGGVSKKKGFPSLRVRQQGWGKGGMEGREERRGNVRTNQGQGGSVKINNVNFGGLQAARGGKSATDSSSVRDRMGGMSDRVAHGGGQGQGGQIIQRDRGKGNSGGGVKWSRPSTGGHGIGQGARDQRDRQYHTLNAARPSSSSVMQSADRVDRGNGIGGGFGGGGGIIPASFSFGGVGSKGTNSNSGNGSNQASGGREGSGGNVKSGSSGDRDHSVQGESKHHSSGGASSSSGGGGGGGRAIVEAAPMAPDGIVFAQLRGDPSSLVVYRSRAAREANPERLNLDRRKLTQCPILENEGRIRLLNYQNNKITSISNLHGLNNLIFLDLYNNHITSLGDELSGVRALRVLMLGKNRLSKISHLEKLNKLDVLDLHSNNITKMENLSTLNELRVLNLAGNKIATVENIGALQSLTELNLRRNKITEVYELNMLPTLQRLFLSNNRLLKFEDANCVFKIKFLLELALDGNPMVEHLEQAYAADPGITISRGDEGVVGTTTTDSGPGANNAAAANQTRTSTPSKGGKGGEDKGNIFVTSSNLYRSFVIENIKTLRHFDLKRVTEEERRQASVLRKRIEDRKRMQQKKNKINAERKTAIRAAERAWVVQNGKAEEGEEDISEGPLGGEKRGQRLGTPNRKMSPITVQQISKVTKGGKNSIEFTDWGRDEGEDAKAPGDDGGEGEDRGGAEKESGQGKYNYNDMLQVVDSPDRMGGFKSETPTPGRFGAGDASGRGGGGQMERQQFEATMTTGPREGFKTVFSSLMSGNGTEGGKGRRTSSSWKGYYEVEAPIKKDRAGEGKVLFIYGDGMDCFTDNPNVVVDCTEVVFRYIDVDSIIQCAPHIFLGTKATKLTFSHNSFKAFSQIQKLNTFCLGLGSGPEGVGGGDLLGGGRRIIEMEISPEGNPCAALSTYREFCAFAMGKLEVLDGVEITREERESGKLMFSALKRTGGDGTRSIAQYVPANLFQTGGRGLGLFNRQGAGPAAPTGGTGGGKGSTNKNSAIDDDLIIARCTEKLVVNMANMAIDMNKNWRAFDDLYPAIIRDIMDEAIHQRINKDTYMENCLELLSTT